MSMRLTHDVAILGSGFAGSLLARLLHRRGRRVLLLEKGVHPRPALGESTTPLAGLALERLAARFGLPDLRHLSTWSRMRRHLPHLRSGLKRGFTFFHHTPDEPFRNGSENENRLLVAASPDDEIADMNWLRADVDHHMVRRAIAEGVDYRDRTDVEAVEIEEGGVRLRADDLDVRVGFVIDAAGALARLLELPPHPDGLRVRSSLVGGHFRGLDSFVQAARREGARMTPGPYLDDRAAVHHLLDEGWMYVLPFDDGAVSMGLVLKDSASWDVLERYPSLRRWANGRSAPLQEWNVGRLQRRLASPIGERWALLPHSYGFVGPMFSTGIAWSLLAIERLTDALCGDGDLTRYGELLELEIEQIDRLVAAAWKARRDPSKFEAVCHLYFATVSYREVRQRLGLDETPESVAWQGFLDADLPERRKLFSEALQRLDGGDDGFYNWVAAEIKPRNIAGLADPSRRRLYGVDLDVLSERSELLDLSREALRKLLPRLRGA